MSDRASSRASLAAAPNAPSVFVPLRFMVTGLLAFLAAVLLLLLRPTVLTTYHYNQHVVAITHLLVLGWICSSVMGAVYQLVPVALETRLHSERLARWQFMFHVAGFAGMVCTFWIWNMKQVGHFGSVFAFGAGLFIYNIARTLARTPRWNVVAAAIASSLFWFGLAILVGLMVAAGKCAYDYESPVSRSGWLMPILQGLQVAGAFMGRFDQISTMHAHAHLGVLGCFLMLLVGVSYRLVPMFAISEIQCRRRALCSVWLLNIGLAGAFVAILSRSNWKPVWALVIVSGLALYGIEMCAILRARKRRELDLSLRQFITALALLVPLAVLGVALSWPQFLSANITGRLENLYGFWAILGVLSFAIIGMFYKVVPFLVWFGRYSDKIGRCKVPTLAELYSPGVQAAGLWFYLAGLAVVAAGIMAPSELLARAGCALLAFSLGALVLNMARIASHLVRPRVAPVSFESLIKGKASA